MRLRADQLDRSLSAATDRFSAKLRGQRNAADINPQLNITTRLPMYRGFASNLDRETVLPYYAQLDAGNYASQNFMAILPPPTNVRSRLVAKTKLEYPTITDGITLSVETICMVTSSFISVFFQDTNGADVAKASDYYRVYCTLMTTR